ncbi:MAG: hypothetical protein SH850_25165 [Planctomycetaceae bacterium]|nr:hypothetical protein [Planctomycetaceae bacterium]
MRVRLQVLKVYDIDVADDCADPVNSALALPTTEIEQTGTLVEVSTDYAERVDELIVEESEPTPSDRRLDPRRWDGTSGPRRHDPF